MLSIIICSQKPALSADFAENIEASAQCKYEIVYIYNEDNKYSIFEAYNIGVQKSKYEILCFMHDDILFRSKGWGEKAIEHFSDSSTGAIAIAGCKYLPPVPAAWFSLQEEYMNIIQHYSLGDQGWHVIKNPQKEARSPIVAFDGVWFCIRKSLFKTISFDAETFKGFHAYDMDIAMQVHQAGKNMYAVYDILIEHFSCGSLSDKWLEAIIAFYLKWEKQLPLQADFYPLSQNAKCRRDWWYFHELLQMMKKFRINREMQLQILAKGFRKCPIVPSKGMLKVLSGFMKVLLSNTQK